ncbi:MAG TPA: hypothetical protein VH682_26995, partial [Gemmataceae bacterium]
DEVEGSGVEIDTGIESGVGGRLEVTHEVLRVKGSGGGRWVLSSILAYKSLHEYPSTVADRPRE